MGNFTIMYFTHNNIVSLESTVFEQSSFVYVCITTVRTWIGKSSFDISACSATHLKTQLVTACGIHVIHCTFPAFKQGEGLNWWKCFVSWAKDSEKGSWEFSWRNGPCMHTGISLTGWCPLLLDDGGLCCSPKIIQVKLCFCHIFLTECCLKTFLGITAVCE